MKRGPQKNIVNLKKKNNDNTSRLSDNPSPLMHHLQAPVQHMVCIKQFRLSINGQSAGAENVWGSLGHRGMDSAQGLPGEMIV